MFSVGPGQSQHTQYFITIQYIPGTVPTERTLENTQYLIPSRCKQLKMVNFQCESIIKNLGSLFQL
jgi:hypothetical protein